MLRRVFVYKRNGLTGEWRKLNSEELSDLYISPNNFRVIKIRRKNLEGYDTLGERRYV